MTNERERGRLELHFPDTGAAGAGEFDSAQIIAEEKPRVLHPASMSVSRPCHPPPPLPRIAASVLIFPCLALRWMASAVQSVAVTLFALAAVGGKLLADLLLLLASQV